MTSSKDSLAEGYDSLYRDFDSALARQIRAEAYGEDIGQHSWVGAEELRADIQRLGLSPSSRLLDLGCGPCGPVTFILASVGCRGTGVELSRAALDAGRARAASLGVDSLLSPQEADLNQPLPFAPGSFTAVISLDVVLHLQDRAALFRNVATLLSSGGRFLFTDAGVVTGSISNEEIGRRSAHGYTTFVPPGWNEQLLGAEGFHLIETEDRTPSVLSSAAGRLAATHAHRDQLASVLGLAEVERQLHYLETVVTLSRRRALSRIMYMAEIAAPGAAAIGR